MQFRLFGGLPTWATVTLLLVIGLIWLNFCAIVTGFIADRHKIKNPHILVLLSLIITPIPMNIIARIIARRNETKRDPLKPIRDRVRLGRHWEIYEKFEKARRIYRSTSGKLEKKYGHVLLAETSESDDEQTIEAKNLLDELKLKAELFERGNRTEGILLDAKAKKTVKVSYEVDGREFTTGIEKPYGLLEDGEKYEILYLPEDPAKAYMMFYRPVFEKRQFRTASVQSIEDRGRFYSFYYKISGKEYKRNFPKSELLTATEALNPARYKARYNKINPKIAYPSFVGQSRYEE